MMLFKNQNFIFRKSYICALGGVCLYSGVDSQPLSLIQSDGAIRFKTLLWLASASGTIYGIDGGTNSMLTRKIPKNTVILFFLVTFYLIMHNMSMIAMLLLIS